MHRSWSVLLLGTSVLHGDTAHTLTRDDQLHDLCGTIANFETHHVAQSLLMRRVHGPAVMAKSQQALVDHVDCRFRSQPFAHSCLGRVCHAGVAQRQSVVAELARSGDDRIALGEWERYALILRDRAAERLALLRVLPRLIQ